MKLLGAKPNAKVTGLDELPGKSNYFIGNDPKKWRTNVSNYAKVKYESIYPGIDLVFYGKESGFGSPESEVRSPESGGRSQESEVRSDLRSDTRAIGLQKSESQESGENRKGPAANRTQLEFDFVVAPGADPNVIAFEIENGNSKLETGNSKIENGNPDREARQSQITIHKSQIAIDPAGDLVIATDAGEVRFHKPVAYQEQLTVDSQERSAVSPQPSAVPESRTPNPGSSNSQITNHHYCPVIS